MWQALGPQHLNIGTNGPQKRWQQWQTVQLTQVQSHLLFCLGALLSRQQRTFRTSKHAAGAQHRMLRPQATNGLRQQPPGATQELLNHWSGCSLPVKLGFDQKRKRPGLFHITKQSYMPHCSPLSCHK